MWNSEDESSGKLKALSNQKLALFAHIVWPYYDSKKYEAMEHFVEALRYRPECHEFDCRCGYLNFSLNYSFRPHYGSRVDSACNIDEY